MKFSVPLVMAVALALALGAVAWVWRTGAVGGSDSACYALMAQRFAARRLQPTSDLALTAPWPDATRVAAPAGFLPSTLVPGAAVPVCAPGYALLIAPLVIIGGPFAVHVVPPLAAAALAWLAFVLARRLHSAWAGVGAAALVTAHPIVLFQAVQPMNDITTAALWLAVAVAALAGRPWSAGVCVGLGLLVRPNLAPAAVVAVLVCAWVAARGPRGWSWPRGVRAGVAATAAALPGVILALALNATLYGSPFSSGYGTLDTLFAAAHVPVNVGRYAHTWLMTGSPVVLLAVAAPWLVARERRADVWAVAALAAGCSVVYLAYRPFPEWWYLRFLLPAVVISLVCTSVAVFAVAARLAPSWAVPLALTVVAVSAGWSLRSSEGRDAFGLQRLESRFPLTADAVAARLPPQTVAITVWQSGGLRFWPDREVVVWDALDGAWLDRAVGWLTAQGRAPAIVIEQWEEDDFRRRFAGQTFGALDWPPRIDVDRRVRIYAPEDRARYLAGEAVPTATIFGARR